MKTLIILAAVTLFMATMYISHTEAESSDNQFEDFVVTYRKSYFSAGEYSLRKANFLKQVAEVEELNQKFEGRTEFEINEYSDMTWEEFQDSKLGLKSAGKAVQGEIKHENATFPETVDWKPSGFVTDVRNQGSCGSCWAFSAIGTVEGFCNMVNNFTGDARINLAEQDLVDCARNDTGYFDCNGCEGGWQTPAIEYNEDKGGYLRNGSYPYHAKDETCIYHNRTERICEVTSHLEIPAGDFVTLHKAAANGTVSISVFVDPTFRNYRRGIIYSEQPCNTTAKEPTNHGVILTGYAADEEGHQYWEFKNSWGARWGEKGYGKLGRNTTSQIGNEACVLELNTAVLGIKKEQVSPSPFSS